MIPEFQFGSEPLTDEQVNSLLLGTDEVIHEMSRPTLVNVVVMLAREVRQHRDVSPKNMAMILTSSR